MNILFVCSGNISRSFMAEMLFENKVEQLKLKDVSASSAGLLVYPGNHPDPQIVDYLVKEGIPIKEHRARQITKEHVDRADLILVMEKDHLNMIERLWPEVMEKVELLGRYTSGDRNPDDVVDPFGKSSYHYRLAQAQITMAIENLAKSLNDNE